jgi:two-component system OmpR family response regulator
MGERAALVNGEIEIESAIGSGTTIYVRVPASYEYSKADALMLATKEKFDIYLLDYHLPDGNGIELCLLIKNFDTKTPILFITGTSSMNEKQALKIGAQGLIKNTSDNFIDKLQKKFRNF